MIRIDEKINDLPKNIVSPEYHIEDMNNFGLDMLYVPESPIWTARYYNGIEVLHINGTRIEAQSYSLRRALDLLGELLDEHKLTQPVGG